MSLIKTAHFAHFHGKLAELKIFHAKCRLFYLILIFWITQNISKTKKNQNFVFQKNNFPKKVVPAVTDICTGGQQCKYELLGSGVNISYYLHGVNFFCYCSKKYEGMQISLSNFAHTYICTSWHYEVAVNLHPAICFIYRVNPVLNPDILTQVYNKLLHRWSAGWSFEYRTLWSSHVRWRGISKPETQSWLLSQIQEQQLWLPGISHNNWIIYSKISI